MATKKGARGPKRRPAGAAKRSQERQHKEVNAVKNAQSWSIDLIVGVIIFMLIIAIFYALLTSRSEPTLQNLEEDSRAVVSKVSVGDAQTLGIVEDGVVNQTKFDDLCSKTYEEVKAELGIESDFCIYLEDQNGNIIPCGPNKAGIGNGKDITIGQGVACGEQLT